MQIVGYDSGIRDLGYNPAEGITGSVEPAALLMANEGMLSRVELKPGTGLEYTLGERHCAGSISNGGHTPCPNPGAPYCPVHDDDWPCASCRGQCDLPIEACREEHAIYLAAFAPSTFKVGVTRLNRLATRLREQGADRGAHLQAVSTGRLARRIETELAESVPDRVPVDTKVAGLHRTVDRGAWEGLLDRYDLIRTFEFEYELALTEQPVRETLLTGTVVGTQGRLLVLERNGGRYAVDLRDLVGYDVTAQAADRELQANLGAFG